MDDDRVLRHSKAGAVRRALSRSHFFFFRSAPTTKRRMEKTHAPNPAPPGDDRIHSSRHTHTHHHAQMCYNNTTTDTPRKPKTQRAHLTPPRTAAAPRTGPGPPPSPPRPPPATPQHLGS